MGVTIDIKDNVENVIEDIEREVKDELRRMPATVASIMDLVRSDAKRYVKQDAELSGQLRSNIKMRQYKIGDNTTRVEVGVSGSMVPYAAIVELGTGDKRMTTTEKAGGQDMPRQKMDEKPTGFPFSAPGIPADKRNPKFLAMAGHIEDWMRTKGIQPEKASYRASAMAITHEIVTKGSYAHPYLRPAWFERDLEVRQAARQVVRDAAS